MNSCLSFVYGPLNESVDPVVVNHGDEPGLGESCRGKSGGNPRG